MKKKSYKITFELKEGYSDNGKEFPLQLAEEIIKDWMELRLKQDKPIVTGLLQSGSLFYPSKNETQNVTVAHSAIFAGELSATGDMSRKGREVRKTLESLALSIKSRLKQHSVFIIYRNDNWCV